jgi:hypothetical protein
MCTRKLYTLLAFVTLFLTMAWLASSALLAQALSEQDIAYGQLMAQLAREWADQAEQDQLCEPELCTEVVATIREQADQLEVALSAGDNDLISSAIETLEQAVFIVMDNINGDGSSDLAATGHKPGDKSARPIELEAAAPVPCAARRTTVVTTGASLVAARQRANGILQNFCASRGCQANTSTITCSLGSGRATCHGTGIQIAPRRGLFLASCR